MQLVAAQRLTPAVVVTATPSNRCEKETHPTSPLSLQRAQGGGGVVQAYRSGRGCATKRATTAWRAVCQGWAK